MHQLHAELANDAQMIGWMCDANVKERVPYYLPCYAVNNNRICTAAFLLLLIRVNVYFLIFCV